MNEKNTGINNAVVIIGGGIMGSDIAAIFFTAGWQTQIVEINPNARNQLLTAVPEAASVAGIDQAGGSVRPLAALTDIDWTNVRLVIECVSEDLALKQKVFSTLETLAPDNVPLTSNSSSFPISQIALHCSSAHRMLGLHFFMPAHLVPAVEVIRSAQSDEAVAQSVSAIMRTVRKKPVQVKRDIPGFLANRIQHAMMREAIALVDEGFATAEDVDTAVRYGFGFRYLAAGPLLQKDLAGIDIHCAAATTIYPDLHNNDRPSAVMRDLVTAGNFGVKSKNRKGFYEWDEASIAREQKRYQTALTKAMQILRDEE